jgi:autotransporter-associated beta strand protein
MAALAVTPLLLATRTHAAADLTWDPSTTTTGSDGSGSWDSSITAEWASGGADRTFGNNNNAIFGVGGTAGTVTIGGSTSSIKVANITFNTAGSPSSGVGYTIGASINQGTLILGGSVSITNNNANGVTFVNSMLEGNAAAGATNTLTIAGTANGLAPTSQGGDYGFNQAGLSLNGNISNSSISGGTLGLLIANTGSAQLAGSNTYSGGTNISSGAWLIVDSNTGLGTGNVNVAAGGRLTFGPNSAGGGVTIPNNITLNGITTNGALAVSNTSGITSSLTGTITLAATSNLTGSWSDKQLIITGQITGPGGLELDDISGRQGGIIQLSNSSNNFQGGVNISAGVGNGGGGPTLQTNANNVIPYGPAAGDVTDNGYLTLEGNTQNINALNGSGSVRSEGGSGTLIIGNNNATGSFGGQIVDNFFSGSGVTTSVTKVGTGTETFGGPNIYSGGTNVLGGTLQLNYNNQDQPQGSLSTNAPIVIGANGTLLCSIQDALGFQFGSNELLTINGGTVTTANVANTVPVQYGGASFRVTLPTTNMSGGTISSGTNNQGDQYGGSYLVGTINTLPSSTTAVINAYSVSINGGVFNVASGTTPSGVDLLVSSTLQGWFGSQTLVKTGSGLLELTASNTYNGNTTISGGTLQLGDGVSNNGSVAGNIINNATLTFANPNPQTYAGLISGSGAVNKLGAGTLTLSGSSTYSGRTNIQAGTLALASGGSIANSLAISVGSGATFDVSGVSPFSPATGQTLGGTGTINGAVTATTGIITGPLNGSGGTLTFNNALTLAGGTLQFHLANASGINDLIVANGGFNVLSASVFDAVFASVPTSNTAIPIIDYTGAEPSTAAQNAITLSTTGSVSGVTVHNLSLDFASTPGVVYLDFTAGVTSVQNLVWASTSSPVWDTGASGTPNWNNAALGTGPNAVFYSGDNVTFNDAYPGVQPNVTLNVAAAPGSMNVSSNTTNYSITGSGKITGATGLNKTGTSTLTLGTANDFTGITNLSAGTIIAVNTAGSATGSTGVIIGPGATLQVGDNATGGAGVISGTITNNGLLLLNRPDTATLAIAITGTGNVNQVGSGTTILNGSSSYTGTSNILAGTLQVGMNNALPTATTVNIPNTSSGTLNVGSYSQSIANLNGGSNSTLALGSGQLILNGPASSNFTGQITQTNVSSTLTLSGTGNITLSNSGTFGDLNVSPNTGDAGTVTIANGASLNLLSLNVAYAGGGGVGVVNQTGGDVSVTYMNLANSGTSTNIANATYNITGGTLTVSNNILFSNYANSNSLMNIGGSAQVNLIGGSSILFGNYYGQPAAINQSGGTVTFSAATSGGLEVNGGGSYTYSLNGGLLSIPLISWGGQASNFAPARATAHFVFNGGTFQTTASSSSFFPAKVAVNNSQWLTTIGAGGAIVDTDGNTVTFTNNLTTDSSVTSGTDGGLTKIGAGVLTLSGSNTYSGPTNVSAGTLIVSATSALPAGNKASVASGALLVLDSQTTANSAGLLNINGNLIVHNGSAQTLSQLAQTAFNNGWNGTSGLISTAAASDPRHLLAVGVIQNDNGSGSALYGSFENQPVVDSDVLAKLTYYGDTDLSGQVDGSDYSRIDYAYVNNQSASASQLTGWFNGDFNYDGVIDGSDYTLIDNAFNSQSTVISDQIASLAAQVGGSAVPEPATLSVIGIGAVGLLGRNTRRRRH